ncbi:hypothetical protein N7470_004229 [Penicillium chermesinum]|nr:hypothetical protein N7470_004229 [Penicillium chermesinum]
MASNPAMLLDPKSFKKRQKSGIDTLSLSPSPPIMQDSQGTQINLAMDIDQDLSLSKTGEPMDPENKDTSSSLTPRTGQPSHNSSPAPPIAPQGTTSIVVPRKNVPNAPSSNSSSSKTSSPALNSIPKPEHNLAVRFVPLREDDSESDAKRSHHELSDGEDNGRPRNLIEDMYGVEQRSQNPAKKIKVQEEEKSKPVPADQPVVISGASEIGKFMKDGQTAPSVGSSVVDLTAERTTVPEDEDDDIQVTGSNDLSNQRVCFGKIENATVNAFLVPRPSLHATEIFPDQWSPMKVSLYRQPKKNDIRIDVLDPHNTVFGAVDTKTARALCPWLDEPCIPFDVVARLDMRRKTADEIPGRPISALYRVSLTVYGLRKHAESLGKFLGQFNVWLGTPPLVESGVPVFNPHAEKRKAIIAAEVAARNNGRERPAPRYEARTAEEITDSVTKMLNQLVSAEFPAMEPPVSVKTPLLPHQKQALWFMTEKEKPRKFGPTEAENNSLWRIAHDKSGRKQYKEIITGMVMDQEPPQVYGGLLADMMGLGKTLSILSLIVSSLDQAAEWVKSPPPSGLIRRVPGIKNAKTTLLIVPLSTVSNWVGQIKEHLDPGVTSFYVFHGASRTQDRDVLASYDIVITTYSTILSEVSGRGTKRGPSPLTKMNLFRIVLDEAHAIREQNAQQTKAVLSLHAQRRWSVTGTPVQNRLEDLISVTKFLRLFPYNERSHFAQYILSRFKSGDASVLASLRVLVDSFTLRRVKDKIDLPPRDDQIVTLEFTPKEYQLHEFFRGESNSLMQVIAGENRKKMGGRMYHHVLKAMMILRQVSAHGKELLDIEERERIKGLSAQDAIDLDENGTEETTAAIDRKAYSMFLLMQDSSGDICSKCSKVLQEPMTASGEVDGNAPMAIFLPCYDILCPECFSGWNTPANSINNTSEVQCPACEGWITMTFSIITPSGLDTFISDQQQNRKHIKKFGDYEGPHTKTTALINYLLATAEESQPLVEAGEPPIKSVIFSAWTSHLDLIEIALRNNNLRSFTRLDGTMSLASRAKALEKFAQDDSVTILLATIGAGGVGLNLTSASQVFIMEPQYNPAAVAQAVDRVHRLGQKRPVRTIQFVMKRSIEEKILELAKRKQQLADMSMNRGKMDKQEVQEQRMQEYRSLFK